MHVSTASTEATGYTLDDFKSDPYFWANHIHPEDRAVIAPARARLAEGGQQQFEYRWQVADGSYKRFRDICMQKASDDGRRTGATVMFEVTEPEPWEPKFYLTRPTR